MTDPEPLKRVTQSPFARQLLESARSDHSALGAANRALGALGVASAASLAGAGAAHASAANASAALTPGSGVGAEIATGKALGVVGKYIVLGVLGGLTTFGSAAYVLSSGAHSTTPIALPAARPAALLDEHGARAASVSSAVVAAAESPAAPLTPQAPAQSVAPVTHEPPVASANAAPRSALPAEAAFPELAQFPKAVSASNNAGTSAQLAALQAVRAALIAHAPSRALALLSDFDARYRSTPLAEEASVLRVEALTDAGRSAEAAALGASFLQKNPHSAYAQRVRSKLEQR